MNDEAGFLQAILAEPDADVHRLVYADWLEEHGRDDQAKFVRSDLYRNFVRALPIFRRIGEVAQVVGRMMTEAIARVAAAAQALRESRSISAGNEFPL